MTNQKNLENKILRLFDSCSSYLYGVINICDGYLATYNLVKSAKDSSNRINYLKNPFSSDSKELLHSVEILKSMQSMSRSTPKNDISSIESIYKDIYLADSIVSDMFTLPEHILHDMVSTDRVDDMFRFINTQCSFALLCLSEAHKSFRLIFCSNAESKVFGGN